MSTCQDDSSSGILLYRSGTDCWGRPSSAADLTVLIFKLCGVEGGMYPAIWGAFADDKDSEQTRANYRGAELLAEGV